MSSSTTDKKAIPIIVHSTVFEVTSPNHRANKELTCG
jgi:hypothetical protein